jgi:hypothetical protein
MSNGWRHYLTRSVTLMVPAEAVVTRRGSPARLGDGVAGELVTVTTTNFTPSWRTQRARALSAGSINFRG